MNFLKPTALAVMLLSCFACNNSHRAGSTKNDASIQSLKMEEIVSNAPPAMVASDSAGVAEFNTEDYDNIVENKFLSAKRKTAFHFFH